MLTLDKLAFTEVPALEYWVYALVDPRNNEIRYIGATKNIHTRQGIHQRVTRSAAKNVREWAEALQSEGAVPRMVLLERVDPACMETVEHQWIDKCLALGARLTNARLIQRGQQQKSNGNGHK